MFDLGQFVVRYRKTILIFYLIILVPAVISYLATGVNYDLASYMPENMNSRRGEKILEEEFDLSGLGLLMARDKKNHEIETLIVSLINVGGVDDVKWLGDYSDLYVPIQFTDPLIQARFATEDTVLLQIQFSGNARAPETTAAVRSIQELIRNDENLYFGGEPPILTEMQSAIDEEILVYTAIAVVMILFVLTISTSLYLDPILFLLAVGIAIIINMGSNIFRGEISFLTASIAAVMQLGISLDYAIFLMHRLEEEKPKFKNIEEAMMSTVNKTSTTVASSALTTIGGFAALMAMQNGIGSDMGFVLGKGIVISLIVTLTLLPGMIIFIYPFSRRFKHPILLPSFGKISKYLVKYRWLFLVVFLIIAVPSYLGQQKVDYYYSNENYLPRNSKAVADTNRIMSEYGAVDIAYVIIPDHGRREERKLVDLLNKITFVDSVVAVSEQVDQALPEIIIPEELISEFSGGNYRNIIVFLSPGISETESFQTIDLIRQVTNTLNEEFYVTGPTAMTRDMAALSRIDAGRVALVSLAAIGLIVGISLKSLSLPVVLVMAVQLAIWINISILYYQDQAVSSLTPIIIGAIQLGATVDYAILYTLRYRENLELLPGRLKAAVKTIEDTGRSILTSALILFAATFSISVIAGIKTTREMTMLIGRGAMISMIVMFTLLPALLIVCDKLIGQSTIKWPNIKSKMSNSPEGLDR
ncbi:MAG: MMPL family transporter [Bacillota bacterium]|nr:MMPL family transporter [Bacillota bacterium]MDW7728963.1 MMPL family transporter [Bacillota bacterium]